MAKKDSFSDKKSLDKYFNSLFNKSQELSQKEQKAFLRAKQGLEKGSIKNYQRAMDNLFKAFSYRSNVKYPLKNEMDHAWKIYQKMTGVSGQGATEFRFFYINNLLNEFDQRSVAPFYKEGDINIKENGRIQSAQIKSSYGVFRLPRDIEAIKRTTKDRAKSLGITLSEVQENLIHWEKLVEALPVFSKEIISRPSAKLDFMLQYHALSAAQWYLFVFTGDGLTVSVHRDDFMLFVGIFERWFVFIEDKDHKGEYILQFDATHTFQSHVWKIILAEHFFPVHSIDDNHFYSRRGLARNNQIIYRASSKASSKYSVSQIYEYNANIKTSHFEIVHNSFFGGLKYK